jgi:predicted metal-dependent HD superfamily phosphohydrolase
LACDLKASRVSSHPIDDRLKRELTALYQDGSRHYHDLAHIDALLTLAAEHRASLSDPELVEAAIWFHDAIYDSRAKDNEAKSAELARDRLTGRLEPVRLDRAAAMILATATHEMPQIEDAGFRSDTALFLDMDLSILAAPSEVFDAYEAAIRREYAWVPEEAWVAGRSAVLRAFLNRPNIYHSEDFRDRFEKQARDNINRSLASLEGTGG